MPACLAAVVAHANRALQMQALVAVAVPALWMLGSGGGTHESRAAGRDRMQALAAAARGGVPALWMLACLAAVVAHANRALQMQALAAAAVPALWMLACLLGSGGGTSAVDACLLGSGGGAGTSAPVLGHCGHFFSLLRLHLQMRTAGPSPRPRS
jgi:hypothetical protein